MATILDFDSWRVQDGPPPFWIDRTATERGTTVPRGWARSLASVAEVLFADEIGAPDRARIEWVCEQTRDFVETVGGKTQLIFRLGLGATNWIAPLFAVKLPPLTRLDFHDRVKALKRYEASPLGLSLFAVKAFLSIQWFEHPDVADESGFDGQAMGRTH